MKILCIGLLAAGLLACSSDPATTTDAAPAPDPVCTAIMDHCHPYAALPGLPMECHTLAEANNGTVCRARQADCFAACVPQDASAPTDATADVPASDVANDAAAADAMTDAMAADAHDATMHMH